ncbi:alpha/beta hydrolase fold domain-containing protein [Kitasatospora aburaviensis]
MRAGIAVVVSVPAFLVAAVMLGAYVPAIPKAGVIGPVLGGQYPFHMALFALVCAALGAVVRYTGLVRWGRTVIVVTVLSAVSALVVGGVQFADARRAGVRVAYGEVFSQIGYPGTAPDVTTGYATREGEELKVDAYLPAGHADGQRGEGTVPAVVLAHAGLPHLRPRRPARHRSLARRPRCGRVRRRLPAGRPGAAHVGQGPQDLVCALGWVEEHADRYGIDPSRVSLGGMSAGGTLAMDAAYRLRSGGITSDCGAAPRPRPPWSASTPAPTSPTCGRRTSPAAAMPPSCSPAARPSSTRTATARSRRPRRCVPAFREPCSWSGTVTAAPGRSP